MFRVVLVDDEQIILSGLQRVIAWEDYDCKVVATAGDGLEGVSVVRRERPDILLTDIRMPNMDGLSMVAALKSEMPNMQISVLTAFRDFEYAQRAIRLGVTRYLLKPSKMDELREAIETMVAKCKENVHMQEVVAKIDEEEPSAEVPEAQEASSFVVNAALAYIKDHYTEHLRLQDVADSTYVSQWHLSKLINRHLGQSFLDIVNSLRVDRAKELLKEPSLKVHEIAELVGFSDVAHFSKTFKRLTHETPIEFRQKSR